MPPIPGYLVFVIIFVIILSLVTAWYRLALYQRLADLEEKVRRIIHDLPVGEKPKILVDLEVRFEKASSSLEQVNTAALIDQIYSRARIGKITYEQIDYWCRIVPNLLLAFGLLGTFLGITLNLGSLSQTINQTNTSNINELIAELKQPLSGMSIAFTTSLVGLLFSTVLTFFNWLKNTTLVKHKLISSLEDYLDNIYQPQVQGDTRLDKIVNKMVSQQDVFLTRFGSTVRDAVEQSMKGVAKQIADGNKEANDLAQRVYENFYQAAGTISTAANEFEHAIEAMNAKLYIFQESAEIFERSQFPQQLSAATADLTTMQEKFAQSTVSLAKTTHLIEVALQEIQRCSQELTSLATDVKSVNQTSVQVLGLHESNQKSLSEIIPQLKQGAGSFAKAINKLDKLEERIASKADSLTQIELAISLLIEVEKNYTAQVNTAIEALGDRLILSLSQQIATNNQKVNTIISNLEGYANQLGVKLDMSKSDFMDLLQNNSERLNSEYKNVGTLIVQGIIKQTETNKQGLQMLINNVQEFNQDVNHIKDEISSLREEMEKLRK
jgi:chromosome segregation ATPase